MKDLCTFCSYWPTRGGKLLDCLCMLVFRVWNCIVFSLDEGEHRNRKGVSGCDDVRMPQLHDMGRLERKGSKNFRFCPPPPAPPRPA